MFRSFIKNETERKKRSVLECERKRKRRKRRKRRDSKRNRRNGGIVAVEELREEDVKRQRKTSKK